MPHALELCARSFGEARRPAREASLRGTGAQGPASMCITRISGLDHDDRWLFRVLARA